MSRRRLVVDGDRVVAFGTPTVEDASMFEQRFLDGFNAIQKSVHLTAKNKGWWDKPREDGTIIALIHSELSECLEALRHGNSPDDKIPEFTGAEAELADVIIRIMDYAAYRKWRVAAAVLAKAAMNEGRPHKHGGKEF